MRDINVTREGSKREKKMRSTTYLKKSADY